MDETTLPDIELPDYVRQLFYPDQALRDCIESYCVLTPAVHGLPSVPWHIMPDGAAHILLHVYNTVYNTKGNTTLRTRLAFVGPRSTYIFTDRKRRILSLIARLKPGGGLWFVSCPLSELRDRAISLDELLGIDLSETREELASLARSNRFLDLVRRFDRLMLRLRDSHARQNDLVQEAVRAVDGTRGQVSMGGLSSTLGVSDRHLRSVFNRLIGLSPKRYARIVRLTEAIRVIDSGYAHGWAQLAMSSGYYDQSHMIDEFHA